MLRIARESKTGQTKTERGGALLSLSLSLSLPLSRLAIFGTSSGTEMRLPESTSGEIIN